MTRVRLLALLAVAALILFPAIASAQSEPPGLPCRFSGEVAINGGKIAEGTLIAAVIGADEYTATVDYAASTYRVDITGKKEYTGNTTAVTFTIDGTPVEGATGTFVNGENFTVDLKIGEGGTGPGGVCQCQISGVVLGNTTGFDSTSKKILLNKSEITGPTGPQGPKGIEGEQGVPGKDASNVMGIVAIVIAAIALLVAAVVMLRKKPA